MTSSLRLLMPASVRAGQAPPLQTDPQIAQAMHAIECAEHALRAAVEQRFDARQADIGELLLALLQWLQGHGHRAQPGGAEPMDLTTALLSTIDLLLAEEEDLGAEAVLQVLTELVADTDLLAVYWAAALLRTGEARRAGEGRALLAEMKYRDGDSGQVAAYFAAVLVDPARAAAQRSVVGSRVQDTALRNLVWADP